MLMRAHIASKCHTSADERPGLTLPMCIPAASMTGLVLAGGRAQRMGGVDKGLQTLHGKPLVAHVLARLASQAGSLIISANRHADDYAALGAPWHASVVADAASLPGFNGPLAGLLAGMRSARAEWLLMVPCDSPWLPVDLAQKLAMAIHAQRAEIATVCTVDAASHTMLHPVFALLRTALADDLAACLGAGERRVRAWYARHNTIKVPFADQRAFYNINSLPELAALERTHSPQ
jgi:molybdopterin-guanine dinucleotide biosynthesis protein A